MRALCSLARSARASGAAVFAVVVCTCSVATPVRPASAALAQPFGPFAADSARPAAPPDSSVQQFLKDLSDSTSTYFGRTATPADTTGLDSVLAYRLAHPTPIPPRRTLTIYPDFDFQRADGPIYSLTLGVGEWARRTGRVTAKASWAAGPNEALGLVTWSRGFGRGQPWSLEISGGRWTSAFDREARSRKLTTLRAFTFGKDHNHYYRREGYQIGVHRRWPAGDFGLAWRDDQQSVLETTTGWTLFRNGLSEFVNRPAATGRIHEVEAVASLPLDPFPAKFDITHQTSGHAIGSDVEYRRTRGVIAGSWGLGHWATLVPQGVYGRLTGVHIPQAMFYLGGTHSMRSMSSGDRGGNGYIMGRADILGSGDVLAALHIPHPAFLPVQAGVFGGVGAVWGTDPFGGPDRPGVDFPHREDLVSEVGVSAIYQPGFPEPTAIMRINYAFALGPARESQTLSVSFTRALDLLRMFR